MNMKNLCPPEEQLADYLGDRLSLDERSAIEAHFSDCAGCRDELLTASSIPQSQSHMETDSVPVHVTQNAVKLVAQILSRPSDALTPKDRTFIRKMVGRIAEHFKLIMFNKNRYATVRGTRGAENGDCYRIRKMFTEVIAEIEIEKVGRQIANIRITLINNREEASDIRVTLQNSGAREIASYLTSGKFAIFENIPFGHYRIDFFQNGKTIGNYSFEIKESA
jgi:hypothetical protein